MNTSLMWASMGCSLSMIGAYGFPPVGGVLTQGVANGLCPYVLSACLEMLVWWLDISLLGALISLIPSGMATSLSRLSFVVRMVSSSSSASSPIVSLLALAILICYRSFSLGPNLLINGLMSLCIGSSFWCGLRAALMFRALSLPTATGGETLVGMTPSF